MIPEPVVQRMLIEYSAGATYREIAARHGYGYDAVRRTLVRIAPSRRPGPQPTVAIEISDAEIIRQREDGFSFRQIAQEAGIPVGRLKNRYYRARDRRDLANFASLAAAELDALPEGVSVATGTLGGVSNLGAQGGRFCGGPSAGPRVGDRLTAAELAQLGAREADDA